VYRAAVSGLSEEAGDFDVEENPFSFADR